ncbi:substrate-binding periplasmic protein [Kordiimonas sp.]|uniref:substrate-binding periplasmic protein n=1 Tax=Kordiimonas sp. TaxID=1970157 RepID=UPI003A923B19
MRGLYQLLVILMYACFAQGAKAIATDVIVYTEEFPPYNFTNSEGGVDGVATANVRQILDASDITYEMKVVPWPRAMARALQDENSLIYTIARTPEREELFDWLVPIGQSEFHLYVRADDQRAVTRESLASGTFIGVCLTKSLSCEYLRRVGIPEDKMIIVPNHGYPLPHMVVGGRADIYINDRFFNAAHLKNAGLEPGVVKSVMVIESRGGFYLAAGTQVPEALRDKVRKAYARLVKAGRYQMVMLEE